MTVTALFRRARKHDRRTKPARLKPRRLRLEELETRTVPSAMGIHALVHPQATVVDPGTFLGTPHGFFPNQIRTAYGFDQIVFDNPNAFPTGVPADGQGQTIAIVDAHDQPNIQSDVTVFSNTFGLQEANLTRLDEFGNPLTAANTPTPNQGWGLEISLDVEWIHALAPKARILLFEANTASVLDVFQAVATAAATPGVSVVSMSFGVSENFLDAGFENFFDGIFATPSGHNPVSFVAASGDDGGGLFDPLGNFFPAPNYPSLIPTVLGVGGTKLTLNADNTYNSESAWLGSGGGQSFFEPEPAYQNGVQNSGFRQSPDVAFDAQPSTGVPVFDTLGLTFNGNLFTGWFKVGGTSFGAPAWSALLAIANQGRTKVGLGPLGNPEADVYQLPSADFNDITTGGNFANPAHAGYDLVTGLGTPLAQFVVHDLISTVETSTPNAHGNGYAIGQVNQSVQSDIGASMLAATFVPASPSIAATPAVIQASTALRSTVPVVIADSVVPAHVTVTPIVHLAARNDEGQAVPTPTAPLALEEQPATSDTGSAAEIPDAALVTTDVYDAIFTEETPVVRAATTAVEEPAEAFVPAIDPMAVVALAAMVGGTFRMSADHSQSKRRSWRV
jgi:hypothetical protein